MSTIHTWSGILGEDISWKPVLKNDVKLGSYYKVVPTEGYIAWEYNPLRNYRLSQNMYEKDGKYYTQQEYEKLTDKQLQSKTEELKKELANASKKKERSSGLVWLMLLLSLCWRVTWVQ